VGAVEFGPPKAEPGVPRGTLDPARDLRDLLVEIAMREQQTDGERGENHADWTSKRLNFPSTPMTSQPVARPRRIGQQSTDAIRASDRIEG
jgi:hypothetical protein